MSLPLSDPFLRSLLLLLRVLSNSHARSHRAWMSSSKHEYYDHPGRRRDDPYDELTEEPNEEDRKPVGVMSLIHALC
jgi:hypothetical protein